MRCGACLREHRDRFVITNMRVFRVHGVLSSNLATMPLSRILDITVKKPLQGRLLGYGHFVFESAAQEQGLRDIRYVGAPTSGTWPSSGSCSGPVCAGRGWSTEVAAVALGVAVWSPTAMNCTDLMRFVTNRGAVEGASVGRSAAPPRARSTPPPAPPPARHRRQNPQPDPNFSRARSATAFGSRVSKSWIFTHVGVMSIRAIWS